VTEEAVFHITCTPSGFYVNKSTRHSFDPSPTVNAHFSHELFVTLLGKPVVRTLINFTLVHLTPIIETLITPCKPGYSDSSDQKLPCLSSFYLDIFLIVTLTPTLTLTLIGASASLRSSWHGLCAYVPSDSSNKRLEGYSGALDVVSTLYSQGREDQIFLIPQWTVPVLESFSGT
jgi:hypothetical protein